MNQIPTSYCSCFWTVLLLATGFLFLGVAMPLSAQNYKLIQNQLHQQQNKTRLEIRELKQLLQTYETQITKKEQRFDELQTTYQNLTKEISLRDQVINKLEEESQSILREIEVTQNEYDRMELRLTKLIEDYKQTLRYLYKHGNTSDLALILTSDSFNQILTRAFYLKKFKEFRAKQADEIRETQQSLKQKEEELIAARERNKEVLAEQEQEKKTLRSKQAEQERVIAQIRSDRKRLNKLITQTRNDVSNLNNTLGNLIEREEIARKRAEEERARRLAEAKEAREKAANASPSGSRAPTAENNVVPENPSALSEEELTSLEASFQNKKGNLPWPVESGVISTKYGNKVHPVYKTKVKSLGVEITTEPRSNVFAIHDGVVFGIVPIRGFGDVVIVNHGRYNTVYGNLSDVYVQKNSFVKAGDLIALSGDDSSPKGAAVFLMIRDKNDNLNPERWIVNQ